MTGFVIYCRSFRINAHLTFPLFPENQNLKFFTGKNFFKNQDFKFYPNKLTNKISPHILECYIFFLCFILFNAPKQEQINITPYAFFIII